MSNKKGGDAKYFSSKVKGEIKELQQELNSLNKDKVKEAVKKVIAHMTIGKDVSSLFTDVVKSMHTDNIELKKLVYLYIINYARTQPDKAILVVNTFRNDAMNTSSALIRALAIRTMGCIRVDRITEYLLEPLGVALKDKDPYVKKTAAICVAKLFSLNAELVEEQGFLDELRNMISDSNPMVVANAVAALAEISEATGKDHFKMNKNTLVKLQAALTEASEWGQVFILDCLAKYEPDAQDAQEICERVSPRLKHANSAVAMSAVRVIMKYLKHIQDPAYQNKLLTEKLAPPLITLLSENKPEIEYVALRNINLIIQKEPVILRNAVQHFFVKYNDPIYVKMEKLEIMIKLASMDNVDKVLLEFKQYARYVDVGFVRRAVAAVGRCAIKLERAAERCITVLLDLIKQGVNYVVQEAVIVITDIFRKYPNRYESIIGTLCENLETLSESEAKASMIWIIGEYAEKIENAPQLLEDNFLDTFEEEPPNVQLQLLTAVVKLFLKRPDAAKDMVTEVLNMATEKSDNPDLRDRGYIYWRLLSSDAAVAQAVVLADKPVISDDNYQLDAAVLDNLVGHISTLSSIYHKPPEFFIKDSKSVTLKNRDGAESSEEESSEYDESDEDYDTESSDDEGAETKQQSGNGQVSDMFGLDAMMGFDANANAPSTSASTHSSDPIVLQAAQGKGLQIRAVCSREIGRPTMTLTFENQSSQRVSNFLFKFNGNWLGATPGGRIAEGGADPNGSVTLALPLALGGTVANPQDRNVQIGMKCELGVLYFGVNVPAHIFFEENGKMGVKEFADAWRSLASDAKAAGTASSPKFGTDIDAMSSALQACNVFFIAKRQMEGRGLVAFFSLRAQNTAVAVEICINPQTSATAVTCKSANDSLAAVALQGILAHIN